MIGQRYFHPNSPGGAGGQPPELMPAGAAQGSSKPRLLLVDDDRETLEICGHAFRSLGFDVDTAKDGVEAMKLFQKGKYAVVVSDLDMPNKGGWVMIPEIKALDKNQKVFVYSGETLTDIYRQKIRADACYGPETYADLKAALKGLLTEKV